MKTIFILMLITSAGDVKQVFEFDNQNQCETVAAKITKHETMCIAKEVKDRSLQHKQMMESFSNLFKSMADDESKKETF